MGHSPPLKPKEASTTESSGDLSVVWRRIFEVAVPGGVLAAILYYLGWAFTKVQYEQMGVDHSSLGFSITDYTLRSVDVIVGPLLSIFLLALAAAAVVTVIMSVALALPGRRAQVFLIATGSIAGLGLILSWDLTVFNNTIGLITPSSFAENFDAVQAELVTVFSLLSLFTVTYLLASRAELRVHFGHPLRGRTNGWSDRETTWWRTLVLVLAAALLVATLFELTREYADSAGMRRARMIAREPDFKPEVVIYSPVSLGLEHVGAYVEMLDGPETEGPQSHLFRYSGIRLFAEANGRLLVWSCDNNPEAVGVSLVPVQDGMWFNVSRSRRTPGADPGQKVYCESNLDTIRGLYYGQRYEEVIAEAEDINEKRPDTAFADNADVFAAVARIQLGVEKGVESELVDFLARAHVNAVLARSTRQVLVEGLEIADN
jgi:hypothetical protein